MNKNFAALKEVARKIEALHHQHKPELKRLPDGSYATLCADNNCNSASQVTPDSILTDVGRITATTWSDKNAS